MFALNFRLIFIKQLLKNIYISFPYSFTSGFTKWWADHCQTQIIANKKEEEEKKIRCYLIQAMRLSTHKIPAINSDKSVVCAGNLNTSKRCQIKINDDYDKIEKRYDYQFHLFG